MLSLIRRLTNSRVGLVIAFLMLAAIAAAFAMSDVSSLTQNNPTVSSGDSVATVGDTKVSAADLRARAERRVEVLRQQQPTLDLAQFVEGGGLDAALDQVLNTLALQQFGGEQGMVISKRAEDGQLASIPALRGVDGKVSADVYKRVLAEQRLTDEQVRADIRAGLMEQHLIGSTFRATQVPRTLALPYASLLLERRDGRIAFVPTQAMGSGAAPANTDIAFYYNRNIRRYTLGERRVVRYATVTADRFNTVPTDAEIAQAYQAQRAQYAPTEKRTIVQLVVASQATANRIGAQLKAGTTIEAAARGAGLEPIRQDGIERAAYAQLTSAEMATTAFGAAQSALVGPVRTRLGYTFARIERIEQVAGRTLDQVRGELVTAITQRKTAEALSAANDKLDDLITDKATFDELIADQKLTGANTPPLLASGINPDNPQQRPNAAFQPIVAAAFQAEEGDSPQLVPLGEDGSFAVVALGRIVPAAARPLTQISDIVARDFLIERAERGARTAAGKVVAEVNKGKPLPAALSATGLKLPPIEPVSLARAQLSGQREVPPAVALLFSMRAGTAKLIEAPGKQGWIIVYLDKIEPGDASGRPNVVNAAQADIGRVIGAEYVEQFAKAARQIVGVKKDAAAIKKLKGELGGQATAEQP